MKPTIKFTIASDHTAQTLKNAIITFLEGQGHSVIDVTAEGNPAAHYSEAADRVCEAILANNAEMGILLCGTGQGSAMRANRYAPIRAALVNSTYMAEMARAHNNANVLVLGARQTTPTLALRYITSFITTPYEGGRHEDRIKALSVPVSSKLDTKNTD